jgi:hypothetical protein
MVQSATLKTLIGMKVKTGSIRRSWMVALIFMIRLRLNGQILTATMTMVYPSEYISTVIMVTQVSSKSNLARAALLLEMGSPSQSLLFNLIVRICFTNPSHLSSGKHMRQSLR